MPLKSPRGILRVKKLTSHGTSDASHWAALSVILVGYFVIILDIFIVNVAIPDIQRELTAGPAAIEFVVAGYSLAYAAGLITGGRPGDLYGRRCVFSIGLALFVLSSTWCGLALNARLWWRDA